MAVAILQPFVPHYREEFFESLGQNIAIDLFCFEKSKAMKNSNFLQGNTKVTSVRSLNIGKFLIYNPFTLLNKKYDTIVLMLNFGHLSTWLILLFKPFIKQRIILWGHGISVKRYVQEEIKPSVLLKWMIKLSDSLWFYTDKELFLWRKELTKLNAISLDNTISNVGEIIENKADEDLKLQIKLKYNIFQPRVIIYCARFNEEGRRVELLVKLIENLDLKRFAFIIIGEGKLKPDFSNYKNVYDFGEVYHRNLKAELFNIADIYFQPGWVGLSIVEAMAYGKPIFTFKRSERILQCVEYHYINSGYNGIVFESFEDCLDKIKSLNEEEIRQLGKNAFQFVKNELTMTNMVNNALCSLQGVSNELTALSVK